MEIPRFFELIHPALSPSALSIYGERAVSHAPNLAILIDVSAWHLRRHPNYIGPCLPWYLSDVVASQSGPCNPRSDQPLLLSSWMKSCRAAVISSANFSGSEDRNNPGYPSFSTGMNRTCLHTWHAGETKATREKRWDRIAPDIKRETNRASGMHRQRSIYVLLASSVSFSRFLFRLFFLPYAATSRPVCGAYK